MADKQATQSEAMIRARGLTKSYTRGGETLVVLDKLDLEMERGRFYALMGPSGSGKTTLLNLVGGLDHADSGDLSVAGENLSELDDGALAALARRERRLRLPGLQPDPGADRARERRAAAVADAAVAPRAPRARRSTRSSWSAWPTASGTVPASSPAARSSASPSRARSPATRR